MLIRVFLDSAENLCEKAAHAKPYTLEISQNNVGEFKGFFRENDAKYARRGSSKKAV